ncbi:hypothetical protein [Corynebacterium renale]|uniref:Lipoprotein n=1 Tax=Corynebacterium renale TaxID=1724 RepID=A0A2A9DNK5_9CORY|nr:hypothetical protein [Corynebacterium renale]PFG27500.1 hypothetical protein ATK06_0561 [Corynebacterium renale]SQI23243.1 Uncharacterised protein [Corynebacterium renale]
MHSPSHTVRLAAALSTLALALTACTQAQDSATPSSQQESHTAQAADTQDTKDTQAYLEPFGAAIKEHWPVSGEIWPGVDYTQHVAVVFKLDANDEVQQAWAFDTNGSRELTTQEIAGLTPPDAGGYSEGELGDRTAVFLAINDDTIAEDPDTTELYRFASHELVHFYHQPNLTGSAEEGSRSESYPIDPAPRVARHMIYHNLVQALKHPEQREEHVQHAKFWHEQWKQQFPEEAKGIAWVDIVEGHARYIENFLTFQTADSTPEEIRAGALDNIKEETFPSADKESYELGYVAGLLLDATDPNWKPDFLKENVTPVEKLLAGVTPAEQTVDPAIKKDVQETIADANEQLAPYMQTLKEAEDDPSVPYLAVDIMASSGSFYSKSFVSYLGKDAVAGFVGQYALGGGELSVDDAGVWMAGTEILVPLPKGTQAEGGTLNLDGGKVKAKGVKVTAETEGGRTVYRAVG